MNPRPKMGPLEGLNAAVAAQIRAEAAAANISDKALAEKSGLNYASVRRWLGKDVGNERHIDVAVLSALADALGVEPVDIVRRAEERMKSCSASLRLLRNEPLSEDAPMVDHVDERAVASTETQLEEPGEFNT